jgi:hypothetical protein
VPKPLSLGETPPDEKIHVVDEAITMITEGDHCLIVLGCPFIKGIGEFSEDINVQAGLMPRKGDRESAFILQIKCEAKGVDFVLAFPLSKGLLLASLERCKYLMILAIHQGESIAEAKDGLSLSPPEFDLDAWKQLVNIGLVTQNLMP